MKQKKVCVIGLGYVGLPMAVALSNVKVKGKFYYQTFGHDIDNYKISKLIRGIKNKKLPFDSLDNDLKKKFSFSCSNNKIKIIKDLNELNKMDIIVLSVNFDFIGNKNSFKNIIKLTDKIVKNVKKGTLILIETTLPPGTYEKILMPLIKKTLLKRRIALNKIFFGYSYERVMPGDKYYNSIINNFRCYSGYNKASKIKLLKFLQTFINFKKFPLIELNSITECETAKILENSYRATNIALVDEWVKYASLIQVDLLKIIKSIKIRPTHSNMMLPGLGVGGYCLPKDALFAIKSSQIIHKKKINFPFIRLTSKINSKMPLTSFELIQRKIKKLSGKKILIMGVSYKENVDDVRNSPTNILIKKLKEKGSKITIHDPMVLKNKIPKFSLFNIVLFCVKHKAYKNIPSKFFSKTTSYFDLNNILNEKKINFLRKKNFKFFILGRYHE